MVHSNSIQLLLHYIITVLVNCRELNIVHFLLVLRCTEIAQHQFMLVLQGTGRISSKSHVMSLVTSDLEQFLNRVYHRVG